MAYIYDDYLESTDDATRADRLRKHITEVSRGITANVAKGISSRQSDPLERYRDQLRRELADIEGRIKQGGAGFHYARISKG